GVVTVRPDASPDRVLGSPDLAARLTQVVEEYHPQVLVAAWSSVVGGPAAAPAALARALDLALAPGDGVDGVVLLAVPRPGPGGTALGAQVAAVDAAEAAAGRADPGRVLALPVAGALERGSRAPAWLPPPAPAGSPAPGARAWVRVRSTDGVDLCPPGITRYAAPVLADLTALWDLPPARPGWWNSYDVVARAYDYPDRALGTCPDDHPG
ncbi:MAG TPA: hypothetical protein VMB72_03460, partial [Acidimicrobiales bacterium]|nr:hypothetical protein [Acidimicrobiales bacterium]